MKKIDIDHIKLEKKTGGSTKDTKLIRGMVVDKGRAHPGMPKRVENTKIALVNTALEIKKTEVETEIEITSPDQMKTFLDEEEKMLGEMVKAVKESGANVLFCQKGIDDLAQHYLAKEDILAVKRVNESARDRISAQTA